MLSCSARLVQCAQIPRSTSSSSYWCAVVSPKRGDILKTAWKERILDCRDPKKFHVLWTLSVQESTDLAVHAELLCALGPIGANSFLNFPQRILARGSIAPGGFSALALTRRAPAEHAAALTCQDFGLAFGKALHVTNCACHRRAHFCFNALTYRDVISLYLKFWAAVLANRDFGPSVSSSMS